MISEDYHRFLVAQQERAQAEYAHQQHIIEFREMCAKMIEDAVPIIK